MDVYKLNYKYKKNNFNGDYCGISHLKIISGNLPIILSAPHATRCVRNNDFRKADALTGGIVEYLAYNKSTFGITRCRNMLDDPNYYNCGISLQYKNAIIELIKRHHLEYLFDIHGCNDRHLFDIDIGTNDGININKKKEILEILKEYLMPLGRISVDSMFKASRNENVSRYINEKTGIPCFQLEISANIRFNRTMEFIEAMGSVIDCLPKEKGK